MNDVTWLITLLSAVFVYATMATLFAVRVRREKEVDLACAAYWWNRWRKANTDAAKRLNMLEEIWGVVCLKMNPESARREVIKIFKGMRR